MFKINTQKFFLCFFQENKNEEQIRKTKQKSTTKPDKQKTQKVPKNTKREDDSEIFSSLTSRIYILEQENEKLSQVCFIFSNSESRISDISDCSYKNLSANL